MGNQWQLCNVRVTCPKELSPSKTVAAAMWTNWCFSIHCRDSPAENLLQSCHVVVTTACATVNRSVTILTGEMTERKVKDVTSLNSTQATRRGCPPGISKGHISNMDAFSQTHEKEPQHIHNSPLQIRSTHGWCLYLHNIYSSDESSFGTGNQLIIPSAMKVVFWMLFVVVIFI